MTIRSALILLAMTAITCGQGSAVSPTQARWFQVQTPNFTIFSSGRLDEVRWLALRLEQFREAYASLAGAKAVASVPVVVMAFPDDGSFRPFQPRYQGQPMKVGGYFQRDYDENVIALNLQQMELGSMELIYHEYAHLLMRHNDRFWPLWLKEGMAEVYSTFVIANQRACVGFSKARHIDYLRKNPFMPLQDLFAVKHDSPQYNEREHRGVFYAQSWALTHYLVLGDNPVRKAQFGVFSKKLREGGTADTAFTESFQTDFVSMEKELKRYLARSRFEPACYNLRGATDAQRPLAQRLLPPVEVLFQFGNLLLHTGRFDEAETYFKQAQQVAPESARPYEGLGLAALRRKNYPAAVTFLEQALQRRSFNYRAHYAYGRALYAHADDETGLGRKLSAETATKIRTALQRSIQLMPAFAPSHYLLGVFELQRGENLVQAGQHLQKASAFEPENRNYLLAYGEWQLRRRDYAAARQTLSALLQPDVDSELKERAGALMKTLDGVEKRRSR